MAAVFQRMEQAGEAGARARATRRATQRATLYIRYFKAKKREVMQARQGMGEAYASLAAGVVRTTEGETGHESSEEGRAALKALWDELDKDGDGTVTSKEWGKGVTANWKTMGKFFGGSTMVEVGHMFKTLDVDNSGDLTWGEFEGAVSGLDTAMMVARAMQTSEGAAELKSLFETLDEDGDGKVTSEEWAKSVSQNKEMLAKYFGGKDAKSIGEAFKRLDADRSGDLTWKEFVAGSQRLVEMV